MIQNIKQDIPTNINSNLLGRNLWLTIFSYLRLIDITTCELVCKNWNTFIRSKNSQLDKLFYQLCNLVEDNFGVCDWGLIINKNQFIWLNIHLKYHNLIKYSFYHYIVWSIYSNQERHDFFKSLWQTFKIISKMNNLEQLNLVNDYISKNCAQYYKLLQNFSNLKSISFQIEDCKQRYITQISTFIQQSKQTLKKIYILNKSSNKNNIIEIFNALNNDVIENIQFDNFYLNQEITQRLLQLKQLSEISLTGPKQDIELSNSYIQQLIQGIGFQLVTINFYLINESVILISKHCPNLRKASITFTMLKNDSIYALLINCNQLEELILSGTKKLTVQCIPLQKISLKLLTINKKVFTIDEKIYLEEKIKQLKIFRY